MFSGSMKSKIHPHSELYGIITLEILWTGTYCAWQKINQVWHPQSHLPILKAVPLVFDM